jgi:hypothetical protein
MPAFTFTTDELDFYSLEPAELLELTVDELYVPRGVTRRNAADETHGIYEPGSSSPMSTGSLEYVTAELEALRRRAAERLELGTCAYFALCENLAHGTVEHPILPPVPTCRRCAAKVEAALITTTTTENTSR